MANRAYHKRSTHIGPGGIKCPCCAPTAGGKLHKFKRSERRRAKQSVKREINAARE